MSLPGGVSGTDVSRTVSQGVTLVVCWLRNMVFKLTLRCLRNWKQCQAILPPGKLSLVC